MSDHITYSEELAGSDFQPITKENVESLLNAIIKQKNPQKIGETGYRFVLNDTLVNLIGTDYMGYTAIHQALNSFMGEEYDINFPRAYRSLFEDTNKHFTIHFETTEELQTFLADLENKLNDSDTDPSKDPLQEAATYASMFRASVHIRRQYLPLDGVVDLDEYRELREYADIAGFKINNQGKRMVDFEDLKNPNSKLPLNITGDILSIN